MHTPQQQENPDSVFDKMAHKAHEQVVYGYDAKTGLKTIIALHSTVLGPALGGTRMWDYAQDEDALVDVLRLAEGMTYKAALAGLNLGGGKAVIIGDSSKVKTEALLRQYGKVVDTLQGHYITAPDVNTNMQDMLQVAQTTQHVTGLPLENAGSGDPSVFTAYGTYLGIKAAAKKVYGTDSLQGKKIGVEGIGKVGAFLVKHLCEEGAEVYITDISQDRLAAIAKQYRVQSVSPTDFYDLPLDVYAPCALGATLNDTTIPRLRCAIVAGGANNQLADEERHGQLLLDRGIVYAPDFLINAGGLINVHAELDTYNPQRVQQHTERIYDICLEVLTQAATQGLPTHAVAQRMAEQRIQAAQSKATTDQ